MVGTGCCAPLGHPGSLQGELLWGRSFEGSPLEHFLSVLPRLPGALDPGHPQ